ncbi:hypothetical protein K2X14_14840 [Acetobacter sp. TBRC 12305]|uniref:Uncharacterized protein n=1 Tax=Acetobacter garciniae TaxID=2817435 RepID=A0A939HL55_9PROT|nr:hypothetical protein [Acetobacter garciniae]MBO1326435.1 hypothetical protein [Acetobacter garciniae]MBX0346110.1 hypothetical protein [Acetobacter garciniae]
MRAHDSAMADPMNAHAHENPSPPHGRMPQAGRVIAAAFQGCIERVVPGRARFSL